MGRGNSVAGTAGTRLAENEDDLQQVLLEKGDDHRTPSPESRTFVQGCLTGVPLRRAGVFVDQSVQALTTNDVTSDRDRLRMRRLQCECTMGPAPVVMVEELGQNSPEMAFIEDQEPIDALATKGAEQTLAM